MRVRELYNVWPQVNAMNRMKESESQGPAYTGPRIGDPFAPVLPFLEPAGLGLLGFAAVALTARRRRIGAWISFRSGSPRARPEGPVV